VTGNAYFTHKAWSLSFAAFGIVFLMQSFVFSEAVAQAGNASVRAQLSQASMTLGDSVSLTVTAENLDAAIDLTPLERLFTVTGRTSSREVRVFNGRESTLVSWVVQIEPKRAGVVTVPSISVGNLRTQPLALKVNEAPTGNQRLLFVEATADELSPFVQAQVILTVKVWRAVNLSGASKSALNTDDFLVVPLERNKQYKAVRDGREYVVEEEQYALFPQSSGPLTFGPIELRAKVPVDNTGVQGFLTPTRTVKRVSSPVTLNVQARPNTTQGQWWLPASNVEIKESWSSDPSAINAKDTVTRTIEVIANGVAVDQLPDVELPDVDGLSLYADKTDGSLAADDAGLVATRRSTWAVVPERNGEITLPAVKIAWFDTESGKPRVAELAAQTLTVTGVTSVIAPTPQTPSATEQASALTPNIANDLSNNVAVSTESSRPYWHWLLFGATGVMLLQGIAYSFWRIFKSVKQAQEPVVQEVRDASKVPGLQAVSKAIKKGQLSDVQAAILSWAAEFWPRTPPKNLLVVAERLQQPELAQVFGKMDAALYGSANANVDLSLVEKHLQAGSSRLVDANRSVAASSGLPAL